MGAAAVTSISEEQGNPYLGWLVGFLFVAIVLVIGAGLWIHFHGV